MFTAWSDADADWVEEIEIVSSFECKYVLFSLSRWGFCYCDGGKVALTERKERKWTNTMEGEGRRVTHVCYSAPAETPANQINLMSAGGKSLRYEVRWERYSHFLKMHFVAAGNYARSYFFSHSHDRFWTSLASDEISSDAVVLFYEVNENHFKIISFENTCSGFASRNDKTVTASRCKCAILINLIHSIEACTHTLACTHTPQGQIKGGGGWSLCTHTNRHWKKKISVHILCPINSEALKATVLRDDSHVNTDTFQSDIP